MMAVTITIESVKAYGISGTDAALSDYIAIASGADDCLDKHEVPESTQRILKINAVGHLATLAAGGQIKSQSAPSGASRSFVAPQGSGIDSTNWGSALRSLDRHGCVTRLMDSRRQGAIVVGYGNGRQL